MAVFQNNPFPGVDASQFANWTKVTLPNGEVYYEVPGHPGYVYDPVASNATGRTVFRPNPKGSIEKQKEEEEKLEKAQKQQEFNQSIGGQAVPVVLGTGGLIAAQQFMKQPVSGADKYYEMMAKNEAAKRGLIPTEAAAPSVTPNASAAAQGATQSTPSAIPGSTTAAYPVGTAADGSTMMSDGSVQTDVLPPDAQVLNDGSIIDTKTMNTIGRVAQGALGAYQIYQGFSEFKDDKIGGALGMASGGVNVATAMGYTDAAPIAAPLTIAKGGYDMYNAFQHGGEGVRGAGAQIGAGIGTIIAPGIGTLAGAAIGNIAGYGLDKLGLFHKTTRQVAQDHTGDLMEQGADDKNWQQYVAGMREQYNAPPPDPDHPYGDTKGNKFGSWEEYKKAGLDAANLTGVYGNLDAYGPAWASLTEDQRRAVTQANIDSGIYNSHKGEVEITDKAKAKENYDNVMKGFSVGTNAQAAAQAASKPAPAPAAVVAPPVTQPPPLVVSGPRPEVPKGINLRSSPMWMGR